VSEIEHFWKEALWIFGAKNANCLRALAQASAFWPNISRAPKMFTERTELTFYETVIFYF